MFSFYFKNRFLTASRVHPPLLSHLSLITALCSLDWGPRHGGTPQPREGGSGKQTPSAFPPKKTPIVTGFIGMKVSPNEGVRVLIADDLRTVGTSLADMVRSCNHEIVAVVGSGLEAIQAYTVHRPDLVLMDYWMPNLNGATACRNILAKDPTARVILVSAWSPLQGIEDSGAISVLSK